ncbi:MAG: monoamine oxidase [Desulfarculus sp.]|jgi:acyl dehydratase|nr:MAG: monoamine oxidase [Desulfarculus sp.]
MKSDSLETFEKNFWKGWERRKTWDEIMPGESRPTNPITLTKEMIQDFARAIGDMNPLYFDEDYAQKSPFQGLISPPSIHAFLLFACTDNEDWMREPGTINAGQSWYYNVPARPGDTIRLVCKAVDKFIKKERLFIVHQNTFYNQNDQVVCVGRGWTIRPR